MIYLVGSGPQQTTAAFAVQAISAATIRTLLQVKPGATQFFKIKSWGISFDNTTANTPAKVELIETDVAATITAFVAADITKIDAEALSAGDPTTNIFALTTTGSGYGSGGGEGSITVVRNLDGPQFLAPTGSYYFQFPLGDEPVIQPSKFGRIRVTAPASVNAYAWMKLAA